MVKREILGVLRPIKNFLEYMYEKDYFKKKKNRSLYISIFLIYFEHMYNVRIRLFTPTDKSILLAMLSILTGPVSWGCRIHRLDLCRGVRLSQRVSCGPVGWGCRIHRLHLCRGVRFPQWVSYDPVGWGCRIHRQDLCRGVKFPKRVSYGPVSWGCRIHRLHLCREVRLSQQVPWIWH